MISAEGYKFIADQIQEWIAEKCKNFNGGVIGISGGIDSAVSAALAVRALGTDKVLALSMPYSKIKIPVPLDKYTDAMIKYLNLESTFKIINIFDAVKSFEFCDGNSSDKITLGNTMARARMILLYRHANRLNKLVIGTTNRTEAIIGYYTKWGDGAVDIEPIEALHKTEVWELAKYLGIPQIVIDRAPSAELWEGQTDDGEIGLTYKELDEIMVRLDEYALKDTKGFEIPENAKKVLLMSNKNHHKKVMPDYPRLWYIDGE